MRRLRLRRPGLVTPKGEGANEGDPSLDLLAHRSSHIRKFLSLRSVPVLRTAWGSA